MTKLDLLKHASGGDQHALLFLTAIDKHLEAVRTFVIAGKTDSHELIALMTQANRVFSLPFYCQHADRLYLPVMRLLQNLKETHDITPLIIDVATLKLGFAGARKLLANPAETE